MSSPTREAWDLPLDEAPLVFVDVEMTGLDVEQDRVLEICAERVRGGVVEARLSTLVRPDDGRTGATAVHGLTEEVLRDAPTFAEVAADVRKVLAGAVWIGHGAAWDVAFLRREVSRLGETLEVEGFIDTLPLARRAFGLPSNRLGAVAASLSIVHPPLHRAEADVAVLRAVFARITQVLGARTARELRDVRTGERKAAPWVLERAEEARAAKTPVSVRYRASGRGASDFRFVVTEVKSSLDPPRILGYLLPSRGRRELRADRVLDICLPAAPSGSPADGTLRRK